MTTSKMTPQEALRILVAAIPEERQSEDTYYASDLLYRFIDYHTEEDE